MAHMGGNMLFQQTSKLSCADGLINVVNLHGDVKHCHTVLQIHYGKT